MNALPLTHSFAPMVILNYLNINFRQHAECNDRIRVITRWEWRYQWYRNFRAAKRFRRRENFGSRKEERQSVSVLPPSQLMYRSVNFANLEDMDDDDDDDDESDEEIEQQPLPV